MEAVKQPTLGDYVMEVLNFPNTREHYEMNRALLDAELMVIEESADPEIVDIFSCTFVESESREKGEPLFKRILNGLRSVILWIVRSTVRLFKSFGTFLVNLFKFSAKVAEEVVEKQSERRHDEKFRDAVQFIRRDPNGAREKLSQRYDDIKSELIRMDADCMNIVNEKIHVTMDVDHLQIESLILSLLTEREGEGSDETYKTRVRKLSTFMAPSAVLNAPKCVVPKNRKECLNRYRRAAGNGPMNPVSEFLDGVKRIGPAWVRGAVRNNEAASSFIKDLIYKRTNYEFSLSESANEIKDEVENFKKIQTIFNFDSAEKEVLRRSKEIVENTEDMKLLNEHAPMFNSYVHSLMEITKSMQQMLVENITFSRNLTRAIAIGTEVWDRLEKIVVETIV